MYEFKNTRFARMHLLHVLQLPPFIWVSRSFHDCVIFRNFLIIFYQSVEETAEVEICLSLRIFISQNYFPFEVDNFFMTHNVYVYGRETSLIFSIF